MTRQASLKQDVLDTSTAETAENWNQLLKLQTKMFLPHEIRFYSGCSEWMDAEFVLDVGCGNGSYISKISTFFPEKSYTGIDVSPELISLAKAENANKNIQFEHQDLYQFQPDQKFDVIIMRLIVQHLSDFDLVLAHASRLLKPGGSLVIMEPDLKNSWNKPAAPMFDALMKGVEEHSARSNTNRCLLSELDHLANENGNWTTAQDSLAICPHIGPFINTDLLSLYNLWIDILESSRILPVPFELIRNELKEWSEIDGSYAQIGIRFLQLKSKG